MKAEHRLRVVIDTNVWISAMLSAKGPPARLVRHVLAHGVAVFTPATFEELSTRLWRPKFDPYLGMDTRKALLHDLNAAALWVDVPDSLAAITWCRDADDDEFIRAALAAQAPWLVTGDSDLLDVPPVQGLRILAPVDALALPAFKG